ncbi:MAG: hypothetical protein WBB34_15185 [Xanthobacteraceae bacterium]
MAKYPTNGTGYLSLQANVICLLLALIGSVIIVRHHDWFGRATTFGASDLSQIQIIQ